MLPVEVPRAKAFWVVDWGWCFGKGVLGRVKREVELFQAKTFRMRGSMGFYFRSGVWVRDRYVWCWRTGCK